MGDGGADRVPALRFDVLSRTGAAIVLGGHLGQQSVPQAQRGIAEARQLAAFQKFGVDHRACDNDFRAPGPDAGKLLALRPWAAAPASWQCAASGCAKPPWRARLSSYTSRGRPWPGRQRCPKSRSRLSAGTWQSGRKSARFPSPRIPADAATRFARRIVRQEFIGQAHRAQRQTHRVANVALAGNGQLAASASQVDHERGERRSSAGSRPGPGESAVPLPVRR